MKVENKENFTMKNYDLLHYGSNAG
jgi:hypothetical protein